MLHRNDYKKKLSSIKILIKVVRLTSQTKIQLLMSLHFKLFSIGKQNNAIRGKMGRILYLKMIPQFLPPDIYPKKQASKIVLKEQLSRQKTQIEVLTRQRNESKNQKKTQRVESINIKLNVSKRKPKQSETSVLLLCRKKHNLVQGHTLDDNNRGFIPVTRISQSQNCKPKLKRKNKRRKRKVTSRQIKSNLTIKLKIIL